MFSTATLILTLTLAHHLDASTPGAEFSYSGDHGPDHWPGVCNAGQYQSPIDIPKYGHEKVHMEPFVFENYDYTAKGVRLENKPNTVKLEFLAQEHEVVATGESHDLDHSMHVSQGGLDHKFQLAQIHFHWANTNKEGSEHLLNQVAYPMEMHVVHFNTKYGDHLLDALAEGRGANDTLAVLGFFFKLTNKDNEKLKPIIDGLEFIHEFQSETELKVFPVSDILSEDLSRFYRYTGSLTTPGCNEVVIWTIFEEPIEISERQLRQFRDVSQLHPRMQNNFRPVRPLHGRTVLYVDTSSQNTSSLASVSFPLTLISLALALLVANK